MGTYLSQNLKKSKFCIKKELKEKALEAIKSLVGKGTCKDSEIHFSWVDDNDYKDAQNLEEALKAWRWSSKIDSNGNIVQIFFEGEKYGDDIIFFNAIAPFVENNSVIKMYGENGDFEWCFIDGLCMECHELGKWNIKFQKLPRKTIT